MPGALVNVYAYMKILQVSGVENAEGCFDGAKYFVCIILFDIKITLCIWET
jgi:hypothetical protein